jgi:hypothetical protein
MVGVTSQLRSLGYFSSSAFSLSPLPERSLNISPWCCRGRVPAVYLSTAIQAILAIVAIRGINNLRVINRVD